MGKKWKRGKEGKKKTKKKKKKKEKKREKKNQCFDPFCCEQHRGIGERKKKREDHLKKEE